MAEHTNPGDAWEQNFIKQMLRLREAHGMTQTDLARAAKAQGLRFHQQTIQRIEVGERPIRLGEAHVVASIFGVGLDVMTSADHSPQELRLAATRMRRETGALLENMVAQFNEWLEVIRYFEKVLTDRIAESPDYPDDAAIWGLKWAEKITGTFGSYTEFLFNSVSKLDAPKAADLGKDIKEVLDRLNALERKYEDQVRNARIASWGSLNDLDAAFPGDKVRELSPQGRGLDRYLRDRYLKERRLDLPDDPDVPLAHREERDDGEG